MYVQKPYRWCMMTFKNVKIFSTRNSFVVKETTKSRKELKQSMLKSRHVPKVRGIQEAEH